MSSTSYAIRFLLLHPSFPACSGIRESFTVIPDLFCFAVIPDLFGNLSDEVEELVTGALIFKEDAAEGRCGSYCIGFLHTSQGHACV